MFGIRSSFVFLTLAFLLGKAAFGTPVVQLTTPTNQAVGAARGVSIKIQFATPMDTTTILPQNVVVTSSLRGSVSGTLSWITSQNELTFDPAQNFVVGERVGVTLTSAIRDAGGAPFPNGYHFEFSTWTAPMSNGVFVTAAPSWPIGGVAVNLTVTDLTGDGLPEAIFSDSVPDSLTVLSPDGLGGFSLYAQLPTGILPRHVVAADLDKNGWTDLLVCASGPNLLQIYFNQGTSAFPPPVSSATGATPYGAYAGDLDADGDLDVATANFSSATISILRNVGGGVLAPRVDVSAGAGANSPRWIDGADFDADGDIDLVCCNGNSDDCSVFLNNGLGVFVVQGARPLVGDSPNFLETRDFDGDKIVDVVTVNAQDGTLSFLKGNGNGTFQPRVQSAVGGTLPYGIQVADIEGDHDLDVVVPVRSLNGWRVMRNDGSGAFSQGPLHLGGNHCHTIGVADWNFDGDLDVVSGFAVSKTMRFYEQALPPSVVGTEPTGNATGVALGAPVVFSFNTNLSVPSIDPNAFVVAGHQSGPHSSSVSWDSGERSVTITPAAPFLPGEIVTVTATDDLATAEGLPFSGFAFEFMTQGGTAAASFSGQAFQLPGSDPIQLEACDFDRDGDSDLAVVNFLSHDAVVSESGPDGVPVSMTSWPVGEGPVDLWAADVDQDSWPDLVVANSIGKSLTILRNLGNGDLAPGPTISTAGSPFAISGGDFDRDGDVDLATAEVDPNGARVFWNDGAATFSTSSFLATSGTPLDVSASDFDRDGALDLAVVDGANDLVRVFSYVTGTGFVAFVTSPTGSNPVSVFPWDTNGDGWVDLVCADFDDGSVSVLENLSGTGFVNALTLPTNQLPRSVNGADLNGDASLDLVTANSGASTLSVFLNEGGGVYGAPQTVAVGATPYSVICGDWNGDGAVDLASLNRAGGSVSMLLNGAATDAPAFQPSGAAFTTGITSIFPNPFRSGTRVRFDLARPGEVGVRVFDVRGREIARLLEGMRPAGSGSISWDGRDGEGRGVGAGVYFVRLDADGKSMTEKILRVR